MIWSTTSCDVKWGGSSWGTEWEPGRQTCTGRWSEPSASSAASAPIAWLELPPAAGEMGIYFLFQYNLKRNFGVSVSHTSLCSRQLIMSSVRMTTPVRPTPALQCTTTGGFRLFEVSNIELVCLLTDWISSK